MSSLDAFTIAYIECALWASLDESGEPLDSHDIGDIDADSLEKIKADCARFQEVASQLLARAGDDSQNGHDFFLTRNGHGAGFWDRGYGAIGDALTKLSREFGEQDLYLDEDGSRAVYVYGGSK